MENNFFCRFSEKQRIFSALHIYTIVETGGVNQTKISWRIGIKLMNGLFSALLSRHVFVVSNFTMGKYFQY